MTKVIGPIFPHFIESDKPQETIYKCPQAGLTFTMEVIRSFFRIWEVVEDTNSWKKATLPVRNDFSFFFSCFRTWHTSGNKLLKTQFCEKKKYFQWIKWFISFCRFIECDKLRGSFYGAPQSLRTIIVQVKMLFPLEPTKSRTKGCKKQANVPKKGFGPIFFRSFIMADIE